MSSTRHGWSVSTTRQLALGPRFRRWPSASFANGPTAARITSSSPWTSAIEPPVNGISDAQPVEGLVEDVVEVALARGRGRDVEDELRAGRRPSRRVHAPH